MTDRHTPTPPYTETPWHTANAKVNVYDSSGDVIGNFRHEEDTAFAIRACNSHTALVEVLELAVTDLASLLAALESFKPLPAFRKSLEDYRAVLKIAKEPKA